MHSCFMWLETKVHKNSTSKIKILIVLKCKIETPRVYYYNSCQLVSLL